MPTPTAAVATIKPAAAITSTVVTPAPSTPALPPVLGQVVTAAKQLLQMVLGPLVSTLPSNVPAQSPVLWTVLAWVRKEIETNLFPAQVVTPWTTTSPNLLVNPSAELADPSLTGNSSVTIPGWTVTGTPTVIQYGSPRVIPLGLSTPGPTLPSIFNFPSDPPTTTDTQFFGGGNVGTSTVSQTVDLSGAASSIDAGTLPYKLGGWLGGASIDPSEASVTVRFLAADGTQLGVGNIAPVGPLDRWFQTGLLERDTSGTIPIGTRSAQVVVNLQDLNPFTLGYNNAFADDLSFNVGAALPAPPPPTPPTSTVGQLDHVFMVYMENKGYGDIVGSPNAPYINSLINTYGVETDYYALTHPSDPNYYPILGGSDFGLSYNCATNCINAPNLADNIEAAGKTWAGYAQGMSAAGPYTATSDYAPDQLPFLAYSDIFNNPARAAAHLFPLTQMATDLASPSTTPNFVWFAANEANNMEGPIDSLQGVLSYVGGLLTNHQYNVAAGDQFLQSTIPTILNSAVWNDPTQKSAIFVTWDEDTDNLSLGFGNGGNHVVTIAIPSPGAVAAGMRSGQFTDNAYANHYSLLRTIENSLGLPALTDNDAYADPLNGFWGSTPPVGV
ncbi:MAG: alkaline phosphatase family protein [Mycobacterium sp.]|nr:alkaline phosphatase family protein [Mycobacterium sp.]